MDFEDPHISAKTNIETRKSCAFFSIILQGYNGKVTARSLKKQTLIVEYAWKCWSQKLYCILKYYVNATKQIIIINIMKPLKIIISHVHCVTKANICYSSKQ